MKNNLLVFFLTCFLLSCQDKAYNIDDYPSELVIDLSGACIPGKIPNVKPIGDNTTLVWADEFDDAEICQDNWVFETIPPNNGSWWNNEQQHYTDRLQNASVVNGVLRITAKRENYRDKSYTSARMTTQDLYEFTYGKVEVRAKLPQGQGTWPAIWMLGSNIDAIGWPECGEIDIMEHGDMAPGLISSTVHRAGPNGEDNYSRGETTIKNEASEFHIYEMNWTATEIVFSVDGEEHHSFAVTPDMPFHQNFYMILNVAMGGDFVGNEIDSSFKSSSMEIDYVRVYR
jgi:beta-glucanase (GH16 family)